MGSANVADIVRATAVAAPTRAALIGPDESVSWAELDAAVDRGVRALTDAGHAAGDRVVLALPTGRALAAALFATLRAGLIAVPVRPQHSDLAWVAERTGAAVIVTDHPVAGAGGPAAETIGSAVIDRWWDAEPVPPVPVGAAGEDIALLARAGRSGAPVMLSHRALACAAAAVFAAPRMGMRPDDRVLQVLPLFHVVGLVTAFLPAAMAGAAVVIPGATDTVSAVDAALAAIQQHRVSVLPAEPTLYRQLDRIDEFDRALATVRLMTSGSSPLDPADLVTIRSVTGAGVREGYGISEAAAAVTSTLMCAQARPGSVGLPYPGVEVRIVGGDAEPGDVAEPGDGPGAGSDSGSGSGPDSDAGPADGPARAEGDGSGPDAAAPLPAAPPAETRDQDSDWAREAREDGDEGRDDDRDDDRDGRSDEGGDQRTNKGGDKGGDTGGDQDQEDRDDDRDDHSDDHSDRDEPDEEFALDDGDISMDVGDVGPIAIRGVTLFSGYWPDGDGGPDADGWYVTGDIGYLDDGGELHMVDRADETIVVAGFTVYPREVEDVLAGHPYVADAAVVGLPGRGGPTVVAALVPQAGKRPTADDLDEFVADKLAPFKRPTDYRIVPLLPRTEVGRLDRGAVRRSFAAARGIDLDAPARLREARGGRSEAGGESADAVPRLGDLGTRLPADATRTQRSAQDTDDDLF